MSNVSNRWLSAGQRSGSGSRQPRPAQPARLAQTPAPAHSDIWPALATSVSTIIISARTRSVKSKACPSGRGTLRRLLRAAGLPSPQKRRAPAHRQRRLPRSREGEMLLLDGSPHRWLEDRGPELTLLGFIDDATGSAYRPPSSFPPKMLAAISACSAACCGATVFRLASTAITTASWSATTTTGRSKNNSPVSALSPLSSAAPSNNSASPTSPQTLRRPRDASNASGALFRTASPANSVWPVLPIWPPPTGRAPLPAGPQPSFWSRPAPGGKSLASRSRKSGPHLLLSPPTQCRQRQRRPMERAPFPDPTPAATLQLRWGQGATGGISRRKGLDLLRRYQTPPQRWINSNPEVTFSLGC